MTDRTASLRAAHEAVENLVNLYFDRVPVEHLDRELLAETIHEGLSDEWDRLYRIEAAAVEPPADRADSHRRAVQQIRDAARGLHFDAGARVLAALDDTAPADRAALRQHIAEAIHRDLTMHRGRRDQGLLGIVPRLTDAVLAVLPADTDRAAVLTEAVAALDAHLESFFREWPEERQNSPWVNGWKDATGELRRMADETTTEARPGKPVPTAVLLATRCDACQHTLNWHRNDVGCTVVLCVCGRFQQPADEPATQPEVIHGFPPTGSGLTPCCELTPFELPPTDRMTADPALVTCPAAGARQDGAQT